MLGHVPALLLGTLLLTQAAAPATPEALARRVQDHYDGVRDFSARFSQSYEGGVLRTRTTERGTVTIKRPGRMRWVYTEPERKEFVSDGTRLYAYVPADKQVIVSPLPSGEGAATPALFLAGQGSLVDDFTASFVELTGAPDGLLGLRLDPRRADPDYDWMAIGVDPGTLQIRYLTAADRQGGRSTFTFSNMRENRGVDEATFRFEIPRGVDVVTNGTPPPGP